MSGNEQPKKITFHSASGVLTDGNISVQINRQGCRCLQLLLSRIDQTIGKEVFIELCWKKYGTVVSDNTVRQTFFQLRKAFDEVGLPADTLKTVPRRGYQLTADRIIAASTTPELAAETLSKEEYVERSALPVAETHPIHDVQWRNEYKPVKQATFKHKTWRILALGILLAVGIGLLRYNMLVTPLHYIAIGKSHDRSLFLQQDFSVDKNRIIAQADHWLISDDLKNITGNYVYINRSEIHNLSLFVCEGPIENRNNPCVPVTVLGDF